MKKKILTAIGIIIILGGCVLGIVGLSDYWEQENAGQVYEDLKVEMNIDPLVEIPKYEEEEIEIPIDFDGLIAKYPDVYAWITVPGTNIDYPIVRREGDNSYYLNHTIEGKKRVEGAIFTEDYNGKDFSDPNTVIYGHNMKNGSMFKHLHKFRDKQFFSEHDEVIIYQPDKILRYRIFAAYVNDNKHQLLCYDVKDINIFRSYLNNILTKRGMSSNIDTTVDVDEYDRIITMSTCTGNDSTRYLVQAVLLSIQER